MRTYQVLFVLSLVILSGCVGGTSTSPSATPDTETITETQSPTATQTQTPTESPTVEPPDNPWQKEELTVSITDYGTHDRNITAVVTSVLQFWEANDEEYGFYNVNYSLEPNNESPDIEIRMITTISQCGVEVDRDNGYLGCASLLSENSIPRSPETVRVVGALSNESLKETLKHEFGHLHGLDHTDQPKPLMNATSNYTYESKPDAVERDNPWRQDTLTVYTNIDDLPGHEQTETEKQVEQTLDYYASGAEGTSSASVSFERVDDPEEANISIKFTDDHAEDTGSSAKTWGQDIDTDSELEYFTELEIEVNDIPEERRGWHVGYWLGFAFGAESVDELPPPFDEPERDDREDWW